jgi:formylglycine-generating enzyme required for sulfatase activity
MLAPARHAAAQPPPQPYAQKLAGTLVTFEMMPVPAATIQRADEPATRVGPFWMMKTEVTWDLYDVFVFELDTPADTSAAGRAADALARPSKPYVLPGDAFGHRGYPALGMSLHAARAFAAWLSAKTGHRYRLPTVDEWRHACRLGLAAAGQRPLTARAWIAANSDDKTHPVEALASDGVGLHDMLGNVAEWAIAGADSGVAGGDFTTAEAHVTCDRWQSQTRAWNETDPQLPKSRWWLTDAFFVGLRLVRE